MSKFLTVGRVIAVIFLSVWISTMARMDPKEALNTQNLSYYIIGLVSPITQLLKALIVSLNLFGVLCEGTPAAKSTTPGAFKLYGGPIMFLIAQILIMFSILVWSDHRFSLGKLKKRSTQGGRDQERRVGFVEREVVEEEARVMRESDGLKVLHAHKVYKSFGKKQMKAVDDLTFGVKQGEVFALVGPNGGTFISIRPLKSNDFSRQVNDDFHASRRDPTLRLKRRAVYPGNIRIGRPIPRQISSRSLSAV
jgi:ABC-type multidrug transport system fused ATPase/permease subunit